MAVPQVAFAERHGIAYPGMVADMVPHTIISKLCETAAGIGFGLALTQGVGDPGCLLGGTDPTKFIGVSVMDRTLIPRLGSVVVDKYPQRSNVGVLTFGKIWVTPGANVAAGDPVHFNPTTGQFSNAGGAATPATATFAGTGNGIFTPAGTPTGAGIYAGNWRVAAIQKVTNGGVFLIFDPDGREYGTAVVGTAVTTGPLRFTIADGSTDFEVGDTFTIPVAMAAVGPILGARWDDTALSGAIARIQLGIAK